MDDSSPSDHAKHKALPFQLPSSSPAALNHHSPACDKVELFRSLFKGRNDVYPLRFESQRTGRSGYQPACANEWVRLLCDKPRIKCFDCANRSFLPVTDKVIYSHLSGYDSQGNDFVIGLYPMLLDDTCYFLTVDFDRDCWQEDSLAFVATCEQANIPCALERSRSGYGAHVWLFFSEALPAIFSDSPHRRAQRRPPPHRIHAVRSHSLSSRCPRASRHPPLQPPSHRPPHRLPSKHPLRS